MDTNLALITLSGPDHPGITAEIMKTLSCYQDLQIKDIGQSIIHGVLSLGVLIELENQMTFSKLESDLVKLGNQAKLKIKIKSVHDQKKDVIQGEKYILSCVSTEIISPKFIKDIAGVLAKSEINIQRIDKTSQGKFNALEVLTLAQTEEVDWQQVKTDLINTSTLHKVDMSFIQDNVWRRNKRLIVFDMDSTLIQSEVIVEMAKVHGVGDEVHKITEEAMNGLIDFDESLTRRVSKLKGLQEDTLNDILKDIKLTEGVEEFMATVKSLGFKTAIISGGFNFFANAFKEKLGIDYAFSNELEIIDGKLTGKIQGPIINAEKKAMIVDFLAQQEGIKLEQVVAIGDGANDLQMLAKAGLGIAFHEKEIVKKSAKQNMSHGPMTSILHFLGINETVKK